MALPSRIAQSFRGGVTNGLPQDGATACQADDLFIVAIESTGTEAAVSLSGGVGFGSWTEMGPAGGVVTGNTRCQVWYAYTTGTSCNVPGSSDNGNHQIMGWAQYRGAKVSGGPLVDSVVTSQNSSANGTLSATGLTTTVDDTKLLVVAGSDLPDSATGNRYSSWSATGITLADFIDGASTAGDGGGLVFADGDKATAGTIGTITATHSVTAVRSIFVIPIAPPQATNWQRSVGDTVTMSEAATRSQGHGRTVDDALDVADASTGSEGHGRTVNDDLDVSDAETHTQGHVRTVDDTASISEALDRAAVFVREFNDGLSMTDAAVRTQGHARTAADQATFAEESSIVYGHGRIVDDPVGMSDAASRTQGHGRTVDEQLGLSDASSAAQGHTRAPSDTFSVSDSASRVQGHNRSGADTASMSDDADPVITPGESGHTRNVNDTVTMSDASTRSSSWSRSAADVVTMSDAVVRAVSFLRSVSDTVSLTDAAAAGMVVALEPVVSREVFKGVNAIRHPVLGNTSFVDDMSEDDYRRMLDAMANSQRERRNRVNRRRL